MIQVFINNKEYTGFKDINVKKPLNGLAGSFEFTTVSSDLAETPVKLYDKVFIRVDGESVLNGYIDPITPSYTVDSHGLAVSGFDKTRDIVDCSIYANTQYKGPMNFSTLCEKVLKDNGINDILVFEGQGAFAAYSDVEEVSSKPGKSIFEFLDEQARKKGVLLSSDGNGNLLIYKNTGVASGIILNNKRGESNNTLREGSVSYDMSKRFSKVIVKSQGGSDGFFGVVRGGIDVENIEGSATDEDVKRNRTKVIISKTATDVVGCTDQAKWEVNKRRSDSAKYTLAVRGHSANNGDLYKPGLKVVARDDFADINSIMLINSVVWAQTLTSKSTELELVANDAYSLNISDPTKSINKLGDNVKGEGELTVVDYQEFLKSIGQ